VKIRCGSSFQVLIPNVKEKEQNVFSMLRYCLCFKGSYRCAFINSNQFYTVIYKATKTIAVSQLHITPNVNDMDVTCNSPEMQTNSPLLSCCVDRPLPSLTGDWKVNGAINITGKINKIFSFTC